MVRLVTPDTDSPTACTDCPGNCSGEKIHAQFDVVIAPCGNKSVLSPAKASNVVNSSDEQVWLQQSVSLRMHLFHAAVARELVNACLKK